MLSIEVVLSAAARRAQPVRRWRAFQIRNVSIVAFASEWKRGIGGRAFARRGCNFLIMIQCTDIDLAK